jgi:ssDNA-binding Zn-finger/Zn-ribbon topoisomerase 1
MEFYSYKVKKSQRLHKCDWCGQSIPKGTSLIRSAGKNDDFWSNKTHPECNQASHHTDFDGEEGWYPFTHARGRTDDDRTMSPEFNELGERIASHSLK